jgi:hypothetical protein
LRVAELTDQLEQAKSGQIHFTDYISQLQAKLDEAVFRERRDRESLARADVRYRQLGAYLDSAGSARYTSPPLPMQEASGWGTSGTHASGQAIAGAEQIEDDVSGPTN